MQRIRGLHVDKLGVFASALCAVHCVVTALALGLLSATGLSFLDSPLMDALFVGTAVVVGGIAVWHGKRIHRSFVPAVIFTLGIASILVGHFGFDHGDESRSGIGTIFSVLGGLAVVAFHLLNWRLQRDRKCCHEAHCNHEER